MAAGGVYLDPSLAGKLVSIYVDYRSIAEPDRTGELTEREAEVVRLIAMGHSNKEIAARLDDQRQDGGDPQGPLARRSSTSTAGPTSSVTPSNADG